VTGGNWHLHRNGQQWGPFGAEQVEELFRTGRLAADDLVWPGSGDWRRAGDVFAALPEDFTARCASPPAAPAPVVFTTPLAAGCRDHPERPVLGVCGRCGALLCADCLCFKRGCICCTACAEQIKGELADPGAQTAGEKLISAVQQRPALGIFLLLLAVFLLDVVLGSRHWETIPGIEGAKTAGYYRQALRTAEQGMCFYRGENPDRGRNWLGLSATAASAVLSGTEVYPEYRRACHILRLQVTLLRGEFDRLQGLVLEADADPHVSFRETIDFFQACTSLYAEDDPVAAERILARLETDPRFSGAFGRMAITHGDRQSLSPSDELTQVTWQEYWYIRGDGLARQGKTRQAQACFRQVAAAASDRHTLQRGGGTLVDETAETYWMRLARERLVK